ncbi:hypothetical protein FIL71_23825, partial [Escherichia coli]|nr:hypothetical protein [Escherichia coli]
KTSIKTITYLSDTGCLEIQGASLIAMWWLLFFMLVETYFGVFSFKRKGRLNNGKKKKQRC